MDKEAVDRMNEYITAYRCLDEERLATLAIDDAINPARLGKLLYEMCAHVASEAYCDGAGDVDWG